jgi:hypothetical protein
VCVARERGQEQRRPRVRLRCVAAGLVEIERRQRNERLRRRFVAQNAAEVHHRERRTPEAAQEDAEPRALLRRWAQQPRQRQRGLEQAPVSIRRRTSYSSRPYGSAFCAIPFRRSSSIAQRRPRRARREERLRVLQCPADRLYGGLVEVLREDMLGRDRREAPELLRDIVDTFHKSLAHVPHRRAGDNRRVRRLCNDCTGDVERERDVVEQVPNKSVQNRVRPLHKRRHGPRHTGSPPLTRSRSSRIDSSALTNCSSVSCAKPTFSRICSPAIVRTAFAIAGPVC